MKTLPNLYNGKLYPRWQCITNLFSSNTVLASKQNSKGESVQMLISDGGRKRELIYPNSKIMDVIGSDGIKRTYIYDKIGKDYIKGRMYVASSEGSKNERPLVAAAKWFLRSFIPERLYLVLNAFHKDSKVFIPAEFLRFGKCDFLLNGRQVGVKEVLAKDFDKTSVAILPKTIMMRTNNGDLEVISRSDCEDNLNLAKQLRILSEELGDNLRTMV